MNGQTLNQSTVSVSFESEDNATMAASDQQPSGALITQHEKEIILSHKITWPFLILFGTFGNVMIIVIHKRTAQTSSMSVFFLTLAASDLISYALPALEYGSG